jgi:hypothetical protein
VTIDIHEFICRLTNRSGNSDEGGPRKESVATK